MKAYFALALAVTYACPVGASITSPPAKQNAAVRYLRAGVSLMESLPTLQNFDSDLHKRLESPPGPDEEELLRVAAPALAEFRRAAELRGCDWALSFEEGANANTAHRRIMKELVLVAALRARARFHGGDVDNAVVDVLSGFVGARHLSSDGTMASVIIASELEKSLSKVLARNLSRLSLPQLKSLSRSLDSLPAGADFRTALISEKVTRDELRQIAVSASNRVDLVSRFLNAAPALEGNERLARVIVEECGGSISGWLRCVDQRRAFHAKWARSFAMNPGEFESSFRKEYRLLSRTNPLIREFTPNLTRFRWGQAYVSTRRALLRAAVAVQAQGPTATRSITDPYTGRPFIYTALPGGFRLDSSLSENNEVLSLSTVGLSGPR